MISQTRHIAHSIRHIPRKNTGKREQIPYIIAIISKNHVNIEQRHHRNSIPLQKISITAFTFIFYYWDNGNFFDICIVSYILLCGYERVLFGDTHFETANKFSLSKTNELVGDEFISKHSKSNLSRFLLSVFLYFIPLIVPVISIAFFASLKLNLLQNFSQ